MSHPLRVRGLKPLEHDYTEKKGKSHPLRVRGLKRSAFYADLQVKGRILYGCVD